MVEIGLSGGISSGGGSSASSSQCTLHWAGSGTHVCVRAHALVCLCVCVFVRQKPDAATVVGARGSDTL